MSTAYFRIYFFLASLILGTSVFSGSEKVMESVNPPISSADLDPKYKELADIVLKARKDSAEAFKLEKMFSADNPERKRKYSFTDPNVLNIIFHDFSCTNSSDTLYSLLTPELAEELATNTDKTLNSIFLVQAGRINENVPLFRKIIQCFKAQKPSVYEQLNRALVDTWGEVPVSVNAGEVAQKRLELLKKMTSKIQSQIKNLDNAEFSEYNGKKWKLDEKQKQKFKKILEDFETSLNGFLPIQSREASQRSIPAGAKVAKPGHVAQ
jgi:hypothetical protein